MTFDPNPLQLSTFRKAVSGCVLAGLLAFTSACQTINPATGRSEFTPFMSPEQEQKIGAEQHPKLVEHFGGVYDDPKIGGWIAQIGGRIVAASELPKQPFRFTVVNSPVINAFALPGGYVYISRGLLALLNSEAEVAGVLAHEVGHVTARHSANRYNRAIAANIATGAAAILTRSSAVAQTVGLLGNSLVASYSRGQEYESDALGVRYMSRINYNPRAQAQVLGALGANDRLQRLIAGREDKDPYSNIFASHPNPEDRVKRALEEAKKTGIPESAPYNRDAYLRHIDGIIYGDSPDQGYVRGQSFLHPELRLAFSVPDNFRLQNRATAVYAIGPPNATAIFNLSKAVQDDDPVRHLRNWAKKYELRGVERFTANGMSAATGRVRAKSNKGLLDIRLTAIRYSDRHFAQFQFITPAGKGAALENDFRAIGKSFRKLSKKQAAALKPLRIRLVTVRRGDTVDGLAKRMKVPSHKAAHFRTLNGMSESAQLKAGQKVKLILE